MIGEECWPGWRAWRPAALVVQMVAAGRALAGKGRSAVSGTATGNVSVEDGVVVVCGPLTLGGGAICRVVTRDFLPAGV